MSLTSQCNDIVICYVSDCFNYIPLHLSSRIEYAFIIPGGGGTLYSGLYGEALPERGAFFLARSIRKGRENCHFSI